jgi:hypothetical protein
MRLMPDTGGAGRLRGVLTRDAMIKALKERGPDTPVLEVMQADVPTISARAKLDTALRSLMQKGRPVVGVTDAQDRLIGLLTVENLGEMMMIHSARPDMPAGPWGNRADDPARLAGFLPEGRFASYCSFFCTRRQRRGLPSLVAYPVPT